MGVRCKVQVNVDFPLCNAKNMAKMLFTGIFNARAILERTCRTHAKQKAKRGIMMAGFQRLDSG